MQHDGGKADLATTSVVASWPKGSFAESVAVDTTGAIFVSLHTDKAVVRVDPVSGIVSPFASFDRPATGLAFADDGTLIVSGGPPGEAPGVIWSVDRTGAVSVVTEIAEAAFLNGVTPLGERFLVCDSLGGRVYAVHRAAASATPWVTHPLLAPPSPREGPGANGIKRFGEAMYVSVTGADRILRVSLNGEAAGTVTIHAERLRGDDFCFAENGAAFIATHQAETLVRLDPDGARTTIADASGGMVGSTAVAFGRTATDCMSLYVTTTGGTWTVPEDRMEPAKLVRIDVGVSGHPMLPAARG